MQKTRIQSFFYSITSFVAFALLAYLVFAYYSLGNNLWIFFTSDTLYIPYLYQDIFKHGGQLTQWKFSPVPYFFPDFILFSIVAFLVNNLKLAIMLFGVAQLAILYLLVVGIGKLIFGEQKAVLFRLSIFVALLLLAGGHLQQETLIFALVSQEHFGGALMYLLGLFLILRNFKRENIWNEVLLGAVCFLTIFSDVVFVTQFFVPVIASLMLMVFLVEKNLQRVCKRMMGVVTISVLASYLIYRLRFFYLHMSINPHLLSRTHYSEYKMVTLRILQNLTDFYQQNSVFLLLWVVFVLVTTVFLISRLVDYFKQRKLDKPNTLFVFAITLLWMSIWMGYLSLLLTDNDVLMPGNNGMRHYQPFLLFPVILGVPFYLAKYTNVSEILYKHYLLLAVAIVSCGFLFMPRGSLSAILHYYPPAIACFDNDAKAYHLQNGVADYWDAKSYTFLSKQHINSVAIEIDHVTHDINSFLWMNTMHDYIDKDFTFLIVNGALKTPDHYAIVTKKFGMPLLKLQCPTLSDPSVKDDIYIYKKGVINAGMVLGF